MRPIHLHLTLARYPHDIAAYLAQADKGYGIEFAMYGDELDRMHENGLMTAIRAIAHEHQLPLTLHGPIFGFDPASRDGATRELAYRRVMESFEAAACVDPATLVFHSSFNPLSYGQDPERYVNDATAFWQRTLANLPTGRTKVAIENIYDNNPEPLRRVLENLHHPRLGLCFDVGHQHCFARVLTLQEYLDAIGEWIVHVHLHDNHGDRDSHLALGHGGIDFTPLWAFLRTHKRPFTATIEGKNIDDNLTGAAVARRYLPD